MLFFGKYNLNDYFTYLNNLQESLYYEIDKFISLIMFFTDNKLSFKTNKSISDLSNLINNKSMSSYLKFLDLNLEKINFFGYGLNQFQINKIYIIIQIMIARSVYYLKDLFNLIVSDTELLDKNYRLENPVFLKEILIQKILLSYIYVCIGKYDEANKIKIDCIIHIEAFKYNCYLKGSTNCSFVYATNLKQENK
ncbi:hypothetical protein TUBRATIS_16130 [Tubulinosema ratisbonensis]|uniref:Uncharacterized protein n=1 Tax=Tubulinosema ratisbonensis TaxID=291195 RepID=A0A437AL32_9MICR|nr:hypothetical protein TUBRATIS_16130 [Tubulinosema ratisbonensis]